MASLNVPAVAGRITSSPQKKIPPSVPGGPDQQDLISLPKAEPIAEHIQVQTRDRICHALALECDRLDLFLHQIIAKRLFKTSDIVTTIGRRISTLKALGDRMDRIREREEGSLEISVMARVVRLTKDVLRESGLPAETRETLFQSLVERISVTKDDPNK